MSMGSIAYTKQGVAGSRSLAVSLWRPGWNKTIIDSMLGIGEPAAQVVHSKRFLQDQASGLH